MTSAHLTSPRLTLAPISRADFDESAALWADPVVTRFIGGKPNSREESWARMLRQAGQWALFGHGFWTVREAASGRFVGEVGFMDAGRDLDPSFGDTPEAGWALMPWAHGLGYASESMVAAHLWADAHIPGRTVCMIDPPNTASQAVAAKLGTVNMRAPHTKTNRSPSTNACHNAHRLRPEDRSCRAAAPATGR